MNQRRCWAKESTGGSPGGRRGTAGGAAAARAAWRRCCCISSRSWRCRADRPSAAAAAFSAIRHLLLCLLLSQAARDLGLHLLLGEAGDQGEELGVLGGGRALQLRLPRLHLARQLLDVRRLEEQP